MKEEHSTSLSNFECLLVLGVISPLVKRSASFISQVNLCFLKMYQIYTSSHMFFHKVTGSPPLRSGSLRSLPWNLGRSLQVSVQTSRV